MHTNEDILKNVPWKKTTTKKKKTMEVNGVHQLLTKILYNIFLCVQQKKETHTGLEQHKSP